MREGVSPQLLELRQLELISVESLKALGNDPL